MSHSRRQTTMLRLIGVLTVAAVMSVLSLQREPVRTEAAPPAQPQLLATGQFPFGPISLVNGGPPSTVVLSIGIYSSGLAPVLFPVLEVSVAPSATPQTFSSSAASDPDF